MDITVQELQDFMTCPMLYHLTKECKIGNKEYSSINEKYIIELNKLIYFLFNQLKNHNYCDIKLLKEKWKDLWIGNKRKEDIFIPVDNPVLSWYKKREMDGIDILFDMWNNFADPDKFEKYNIIAVNTPYRLDITNSITVVGTFPLIRTFKVNEKKENIELFMFNLHNPLLSLKKDLAISILSLAFRKCFNTTENHIYIRELDKKKTISTTRKTEELKIAKKTILDIVIAMKSKYNYRLLSKRCETCPYSYYCKQI